MKQDQHLEEALRRARGAWAAEWSRTGVLREDGPCCAEAEHTHAWQDRHDPLLAHAQKRIAARLKPIERVNRGSFKPTAFIAVHLYSPWPLARVKQPPTLNFGK